MLNHIRLIFMTLLMGLFLVACGDENAPEPTTAEKATTATESAAMSSIEEGMTEEQAVAKFGKPTISQTRTIDELTITHYEWHSQEGITSIQFQNGKAKYSQFIPAQ